MQRNVATKTNYIIGSKTDYSSRRRSTEYSSWEEKSTGTAWESCTRRWKKVFCDVPSSSSTTVSTITRKDEERFSRAQKNYCKAVTLMNVFLFSVCCSLIFCSTKCIRSA